MIAFDGGCGAPPAWACDADRKESLRLREAVARSISRTSRMVFAISVTSRIVREVSVLEKRRRWPVSFAIEKATRASEGRLG